LATNTYVALDKVTVGTATASVTFSSISSGYTDLVIAASFLPSVSTNQPYIQFNADTGTSTTNYSTTSLRGDGSSAASGRHTNQYGWFPVPGPGIGTNGNPEPWLINIMNYSNTTTFKSGLTRFNNASSIVSANAHLWRSTAAITSVTITMESGNFAVGSTFSLYGIAAIGGITPKATGGTVTSDATYWYHTFEMSGNFVPNQSLSCDYLVVAGGGGGGGSRGGGGGGGGLLTGSAFSVTAQSYPITVGGGGVGTSDGGTKGSNSVFSSITSTGGGLGGSIGTILDGGSGGSGGGGGGASTTQGAGGAASPSGQGNAGGYGRYNGVNGRAGGGGGGAGAAGGNGVSAPTFIAGAGGAGLSNSYSGSAVTYAGGGGGGGSAGGTGGAGGAGGGGTGAFDSANGTNGTTNLGGGGGGGGNIGGNGGSGIVIIRYAK
jgi:hypothetical protein